MATLVFDNRFCQTFNNHITITVDAKDSCDVITGYRENNFVVLLANSSSPNDYVICGQWQGIAILGANLFVPCKRNLPSARYVAIVGQNSADNILNICEVLVYGDGMKFETGNCVMKGSYRLCVKTVRLKIRKFPEIGARAASGFQYWGPDVFPSFSPSRIFWVVLVEAGSGPLAIATPE
jgi:hypothetical protein